MIITGTIKQILPIEEGITKSDKVWRSQMLVLEYGEQHKSIVAIKVNPEKIDLSEFTEGEQVNVSINLESREYNGKYYNEVKAWRIQR